MPAVQTFSNRDREARAPASHVALVTPSDDEDLPFVVRAVAFATAGDIKVTTLGGETVVIPSGILAPGGKHPVEWVRIWQTGTTALGIVAFW